MKALLLGNSPALVHPTIDLSIIPRGKVIVFGANRLWHNTKPEWQLILPDFLGMIDYNIEKTWMPPEDLIHGFLIPDGRIKHARELDLYCGYKDRHDLITRKVQKHEEDPDKPFPERGEPYWFVKSTPGFLAQFILEFDAFDQIGILGVEYSSQQLFAEGQQKGVKAQTHWYGFNPRSSRSPKVHGSNSMAFWTRLFAHCARIGVDVRNLSPFPKTPFDTVGIQRQAFNDWIRG